MSIGPNIVTDNLTLAADAGDPRSYVSGSSIVNNPATPSYSGSLNNLANTIFNTSSEDFGILLMIPQLMKENLLIMHLVI